MKRQATLSDIWSKRNKTKEPDTGSDRTDHVDKTSLLNIEGLPAEFFIVDVPKDGNCLFSALSKQLGKVGIEKTSDVIRQDIVTFLRSNTEFVTQVSITQIISTFLANY
jgi:hypothetical protein